MEEDDRIRHRLDEHSGDADMAACRTAVCDRIGQALTHVGHLLWIGGYMIGPHRVSSESPWSYGDDRIVGVATVAQVGGELATGSAMLLRAGNLYGAAALVRQVVEVQYLAHAFAEDHEVAADWLRADRKKRLSFWSPSQLRRRAGGRFLESDYWHHCELGGHPTTRGMALLPGHNGLKATGLWVDLAGHLASIWTHVTASAERSLGTPIPTEWQVSDVYSAIEHWASTDDLYIGLRDM